MTTVDRFRETTGCGRWAGRVGAADRRLIRSSVALMIFLLPLAGLAANKRNSNALANASTPSLIIERLAVDGQSQKLGSNTVFDSNGQLVLPSGAHRLEFWFGPTPEAVDQPLRLRYKLRGQDKDWHEFNGGMRFSLWFLNASDDVLRVYDYYARGESEGWKGSFANSIFSKRHKTFTVPEDAASIRLVISSGGPNEILGAYAIDEIKLAKSGSATEPSELLMTSDFEKGKNLDHVEGTPHGWQRSGLRKDILQVVRLEGKPAKHALVLLDDHVRSYGEWTYQLPLNDRVKEGDLLTLEWKEMYSVGEGGSRSGSYGYVPPGTYTFCVSAVSPFGQPVGREVSIGLVIPEHYWQTPWFIALAVGCGGTFLGLVVRQITRRRLQRHLERLEWQQALERERTRIARDIHDDLGTSLTRITMLSESTRSAPDNPPQTVANLENITDTAREMTRAMDEIVWAVDPENDSLDSLATYFGGFAQELMSAARVRCRLDFPLQLPRENLPAETRHNLFLAYKEALNNILKHSKATEVHISLEVIPPYFVLAIADNGNGFQPRPGPKPAARQTSSGLRVGNGLVNMKSRLDKLGGQFELTSEPDRGTCIRFIVPLKPSVS